MGGNTTIGLERLLHAVQELSLATRLNEVQEIARTAARDLAGCDGATFVLRDGDLCYYADEDAIEPLWKGLRFPLEACISGWAMLHREHVVIPDIYVDERIPHEAYRPTFVKSLVMTPIRTMAPVGAIGAYWADNHDASDEEISLLRALADATSLALEKVSIHQELEQEVAMAQEAYRLSQTDELTGLLNRRGFTEFVTSVFSPGAVAFVDINGLKLVNDVEGHSAGDRLIVSVADTLRAAVRPDDVVGRMGGDEFAVFAPGLPAATLLDRLATAIGNRGSVGTATLDQADRLQDALLVADAEMYSAKRLTRSDLSRA
ncbi:sensor domain-containing diguanylate cyclase [Nocardioides humilatus]|uniref:Sensor domain-containing diguanylate cyclase n=1 Tax=Nocardioides humilatus TaxID=2607660 RepID=A0A5B1LF31_9ACTN|nr:sensor domain-containing diguanylate cyclase [Nocardioides humilatus]KAA1418934.1 sensor domain-containing diguanylate cyclase [Nocardioides humilatus]